jgi:hypothetical protein
LGASLDPPVRVTFADLERTKPATAEAA